MTIKRGMARYLIIIAGPTAVGKTEVAIKVAKALNAEIISADSRQFYRRMDIGTAKPSAKQLQNVRHHFIDTLDPSSSYTAGDFERDCLKLLDHLFSENPYAVMTGGTGLYIKAVCEGFDHFPRVPSEIRDKYILRFKFEGIEMLQKELSRKDPEYFQKVDLNNPQRLIRALSVTEATGRPYSTFLGISDSKRDFTPIKILLDLPREQLYKRIEDRVDSMIGEGLIKEVESLLSDRHQDSLDTIGYREIFQFIDGTIDLGTAVDQIKKNTRRYAKRQMTWFRNQHYQVFHPDEVNQILEHITSVTR